MKSGIYKISSKSNPSMYYIGRSKDIDKRISAHFSLLRNNSHHSTVMQDYYNEYGEHDLTYETVILCNGKSAQIKLEQYLIDNNPPFNVSSNSKGGGAQNEFINIKGSDIIEGNDKYHKLVDGIKSGKKGAIIKYFHLMYGKPPKTVKEIA